jgi:hypothetical protein
VQVCLFRNFCFGLIVLVRWQARREGDRNMRAGLIPSRALQERRILHERTQQDKTSEEGEIKGSVVGLGEHSFITTL